MASQNRKTDGKTIMRCMNCSICGVPYQTVPMPGIFVPGSRVLFIGQNPAVMKYDEEKQEYRDTFGDYNAILKWYAKWFMKSTAYKAIGEIYLWENWMRSGIFSYTNAVRCRTVLNSTPDRSMSVNCKQYTMSFASQYDGIILMGALAKLQYYPSANMNVLYRTPKQFIVHVPHYASRYTSAKLLKGRDAIALMLERLGTDAG